MTKRQSIVFSLLKRTWSPTTAIDLYTTLHKENCNVSLSTIYLSLKLFVKEGWVEEIEGEGSSKYYVVNEEMLIGA
ncbi:transcriptional repressor [Paenibacillus assamensis]|uniref:transcriptional repressor n=1 Tax=Paenibacillus assamensis TaxID=311244 RepID=UPI00040687DF|nr:transcriptional repressor [Paenibacillus assamensis]